MVSERMYRAVPALVFVGAGVYFYFANIAPGSLAGNSTNASDNGTANSSAEHNASSCALYDAFVAENCTEKGRVLQETQECYDMQTNLSADEFYRCRDYTCSVQFHEALMVSVFVAALCCCFCLYLCSLESSPFTWTLLCIGMGLVILFCVLVGEAFAHTSELRYLQPPEVMTMEEIEATLRRNTSDNNYTFAERILRTTCSGIPPELEGAFYDPLELICTALMVFVCFSGSIASYHIVKHYSQKVPWIKRMLEPNDEAELLDNQLVDSNEEAQHIFFWGLQLALAFWFFGEYMSYQPTGNRLNICYDTCFVAQIQVSFLYKPFFIPMLVCLLNAASVYRDVQLYVDEEHHVEAGKRREEAKKALTKSQKRARRHHEKRLKENSDRYTYYLNNHYESPWAQITLMCFTLFLFAVYCVFIIPQLPLSFCFSPILLFLFLMLRLVNGIVGRLVLFASATVPRLLKEADRRMILAARAAAGKAEGAENTPAPAGQDDGPVLTEEQEELLYAIADKLSSRLLVLCTLTVNLFSLCFMFYYVDNSNDVWNRLNRLCFGEFVSWPELSVPSFSFRFSWMRWPNWSLKMDLQIALGFAFVSAHQLLLVFAAVYHRCGSRVRKVPSIMGDVNAKLAEVLPDLQVPSNMKILRALVSQIGLDRMGLNPQNRLVLEHQINHAAGDDEHARKVISAIIGLVRFDEDKGDDRLFADIQKLFLAFGITKDESLAMLRGAAQSRISDTLERLFIAPADGAFLAKKVTDCFEDPLKTKRLIAKLFIKTVKAGGKDVVNRHFFVEVSGLLDVTTDQLAGIMNRAFSNMARTLLGQWLQASHPQLADMLTAPGMGANFGPDDIYCGNAGAMDAAAAESPVSMLEAMLQHAGIAKGNMKKMVEAVLVNILRERMESALGVKLESVPKMQAFLQKLAAGEPSLCTDLAAELLPLALGARRWDEDALVSLLARFDMSKEEAHAMIVDAATKQVEERVAPALGWNITQYKQRVDTVKELDVRLKDWSIQRVAVAAIPVVCLGVSTRESSLKFLSSIPRPRQSLEQDLSDFLIERFDNKLWGRTVCSWLDFCALEPPLVTESKKALKSLRFSRKKSSKVGVIDDNSAWEMTSGGIQDLDDKKRRAWLVVCKPQTFLCVALPFLLGNANEENLREFLLAALGFDAIRVEKMLQFAAKDFLVRLRERKEKPPRPAADDEEQSDAESQPPSSPAFVPLPAEEEDDSSGPTFVGSVLNTSGTKGVALAKATIPLMLKQPGRARSARREILDLLNINGNNKSIPPKFWALGGADSSEADVEGVTDAAQDAAGVGAADGSQTAESGGALRAMVNTGAVGAGASEDKTE